jgi:hypothetical protein
MPYQQQCQSHTCSGTIINNMYDSDFSICKTRRTAVACMCCWVTGAADEEEKKGDKGG